MKIFKALNIRNIGKYLLIESFHRGPTKTNALRFFFGGSIWWLFSRALWNFTVRILWRFNNNLFGKELRFCRFLSARILCFSDEKKEFNARKNFVVSAEDPLRGLTDFMGYRTSWVIRQIERRGCRGSDWKLDFQSRRMSSYVNC